MYIDLEKYHLTEILHPARDQQILALKIQMTKDERLAYILTTPLKQLAKERPEYKYLSLPSVSLIKTISAYIHYPNAESYFIKTSMGLFVGFITLLINRKNESVEDILLFSFGLSEKEDEDMIRKDIPRLLNQSLKIFTKVRWTSHKTKKANIAYEIYRRKHNGVRNDLGSHWEYICYRKTASDN